MRKMIAVCTTITLVACGNPVEPDPGEPDPGFVAVTVSSTDPGTGALQLTITGGGALVDSVRSLGFTLFGSVDSPTQHRGIVVGLIGGGEVLRFWIPDRNDLATYQATVNEAAASGSYTQMTVTGIGVTLVPVDP